MTEANASAAISALEQKIRDMAIEKLSERVNDLFAPIFEQLDAMPEASTLLHGVEIEGHTADAVTVLEKIMALVSDTMEPAAIQASHDALLAAAQQILDAPAAPETNTENAA